MELPELGQQCCYTDCKQLDFLPLQCQCGKQFCSEHFHTHVQSCQAGTTQNVTQQEPKSSVSYKCSAESCNDISLVPLVCPKCQKHFCVKHRHYNDCQDNGEAVAKFKEKRAATLRDFNDAKMAVDEQIHHNLMQAKKKAKNKNLAKQVQLMKIKSKAKGLNSIPTADRLYFNIICPGLAQGKPVFVSKNWSVGRAIDAIANECKLQNNNNASTSKKLRLFKDDSGEAVSRDLATVLETLISSGAIVNGENLIVEYVDDGCQVLVKQS